MRGIPRIPVGFQFLGTTKKSLIPSHVGIRTISDASLPQMRACGSIAVILAFSAALPLVHAATDCFADPTNADCADPSVVAYDATADLDGLCKMMAHMPGCSVRSACERKDLNSTGDYCKDWSLLSNTCSEAYGEKMTAMAGCDKYVKLCKAGTKVAGCNTGIPNLITTKNLVADTAAACTAATDAISTCTQCKTEMKVKGECPDPLLALSNACAKASDSDPCKNWKKMCAGAKGLEFYCDVKTSAGRVVSSAAAAASLVVVAATTIVIA